MDALEFYKKKALENAKEKEIEKVEHTNILINEIIRNFEAKTLKARQSLSGKLILFGQSPINLTQVDYVKAKELIKNTLRMKLILNKNFNRGLEYRLIELD